MNASPRHVLLVSITLLLALASTAGCYRAHGLDGPTPTPLDAGPPLAPDARPVPPPDAAVEPSRLRAVALAAGRDHACALTDAAEVYCWGANDSGQISGEPGDSATPRLVPGLPPVLDLAAGATHTCATDDRGGVWCWGSNAERQLGAPRAMLVECGGIPCSRVPLRVPDMEPATRVIAAEGGTAVQLFDGTWRNWGLGRAVRRAPLDELRGAIALAFGRGHGCAVTAEGLTRCFGDSSFGMSGDGDRTDGFVALDAVVQIDVGADHACALDSISRVWCWGSDWAGALGAPDDSRPTCIDGDTGSPCAETPIRPATSPLAWEISVGEGRTCVLGVDGRVGCWGSWTVNGSRSWCGGSPEECDPVMRIIEGLDAPFAIAVGRASAAPSRATAACAAGGTTVGDSWATAP